MTDQTMKSIVSDFHPATGLSRSRTSIKRYLSAMSGMFYDLAAYAAALEVGDQLVYEFFDMGVPHTEKDVAYGTSITYPGRIGDEFHMTKGHFHKVIDTAEVYYCLRGHGYIMMENPEGDVEARELQAGQSVYVPGRYAHRSINVSPSEPFITFFAFPGHAGHDYGTIEAKGFRKLVVARGGKPSIIDNPRWAG